MAYDTFGAFAPGKKKPAPGPRSEYTFKKNGHPKFSFQEDSDLAALKTLAERLKIPFPITLMRFARAGGGELWRGNVRVYPPSNTNA